MAGPIWVMQMKIWTDLCQGKAIKAMSYAEHCTVEAVSYGGD